MDRGPLDGLFSSRGDVSHELIVGQLVVDLGQGLQESHLDRLRPLSGCVQSRFQLDVSVPEEPCYVQFLSPYLLCPVDGPQEADRLGIELFFEVLVEMIVLRIVQEQL